MEIKPIISANGIRNLKNVKTLIIKIVMIQVKNLIASILTLIILVAHGQVVNHVRNLIVQLINSAQFKNAHLQMVLVHIQQMNQIAQLYLKINVILPLMEKDYHVIQMILGNVNYLITQN
ncbi:unnamed protein product [Paramecium primaurelia]|uniref:Transmembrane protein n=1 Tax=Paramecium primaurelia TaxID=5886 RepID=A0A8S1NDS3_PARPR|nr:unnamed protein product [Paramecium primaurelia]